MTTDADDRTALDRKPGPGRPSAPADVWAAIKRDYLSGLPAHACCHRYGVGLTALRDRARREGWRRLDQGWTPPNQLDPEDEGVKLEFEIDGDLDRVDPRQIAYVAWRRMLRAAMRGDANEALRWRRVHVVLETAQHDLERQIRQDESVHRYYYGPPAARPAPGFPDGPNGPDGVSASGYSAAPDPDAVPPAG